MEPDRKKVKEALREIETVLWQDWDPIGINGVSNADDEYDGYADAVFTVAFNTSSAMAVAEHLVAVEHASMGFERRDPSELLPVAEKILRIVEKVCSARSGGGANTGIV